MDPAQNVVWANLAEAEIGLAATKTGTDQQAAMDKGLAAYQKAIELKPDDPSFHNNYALALVKNKKLPEAQAELTKAAQLDPTNAGKYYYNMGAVLVNSGQMDGAGEAFKKAIAANPNYAPAQYQYGVFLVSKATTTADGKVVPPEGTVEAFQKYLELDPTGPYAESAKGMLQTLTGSVATTYQNPNAKPAPKRKRISATGFKSGASFPITADGPLCGNPFPNKPSHTEDQHFSFSPPRSRFLPPSFSSCIISLRRAHDFNPVRPAFCVSVGGIQLFQPNRFAETQRTFGEGSQARVAIAAVLHRIRQSRV